MEKEIWKDIPEYEGYYQVSNLGRVKSLDRFGTDGRIVKNKILKSNLGTNGYLHIWLTKNKKYKLYLLHRLVYYSFHPERNSEEDKRNSLEVNHINENRQDNKLCNLNLLSRSDNLHWNNGVKRRSEKLKKSHYKLLKIPKSVLQYDSEGNFIREYSSIHKTRLYGFHSGSVSRCCKGLAKKHKNYIWKYKE